MLTLNRRLALRARGIAVSEGSLADPSAIDAMSHDVRVRAELSRTDEAAFPTRLRRR